MTYLLIAFLVVVLIPLYTATWRMSLLGLSLQGLLLGWLAARGHGWHSVGAVLLLMDLIVLRGLVGPRILHRVLSGSSAPRRNDVIPSNLFSWMLVAALVFVSFRFASTVLRTGFSGAIHLAVATAALLLGMFVLASQRSMVSQMIGMLRLENAVVLFELMSPHPVALPVQLGVSGVYLLTVMVFGSFLRAAAAEPGAPDGAARPTL